jgi:hypothetical protein
MDKFQIVELLGTLLEEELTEESRIQAFQEAGLLTRDEGLVVRLPNGDEFRVTVVQSKFSKENE